MSDDAKREGLSDERCDDIALDARERVRGMAAWGMHLDRALIRAGYALAAPTSAQTPAGERERFERWAAAQPLMSWLAANCMEGICGGPSPSTPSQESPSREQLADDICLAITNYGEAEFAAGEWTADEDDTEAHGDPEEVTAAFFAQDDLFAYMTNLRIAVTPEYEGDWTARMYEDQEEPTHVARGDSPRAAIEAVITLSHEPGLEECPCCDDTGCSNCEPGPSTPSQGSPQEPTRAMLDAARDWSNKKYGKAIGDDAARGCWQAMLAALSSSSREVRP
mgnify:CR=1 FL=1